MDFKEKIENTLANSSFVNFEVFSSNYRRIVGFQD